MEIETETAMYTEMSDVEKMLKKYKVTKETVSEKLKKATQYAFEFASENEEWIKDCGFPRELAEIVLHAYKCGLMVYLQKWSEAQKGFDEYDGKYRRLAVKMADFMVGKEDNDGTVGR